MMTLRGTSALLTVSLVACAGGGGPLDPDANTWDTRQNGIERPGLLGERPPSSEDRRPAGEPRGSDGFQGGVGDAPAPGGGGGAVGFVCSGTFTCALGNESTSVTLSQQGGECVGRNAGPDADEDDGPIVFASDGTLRSAEGEVGGTWVAIPGGFRITIQVRSNGQDRSVSVDCTR